ncbi:hypothetical protein TIFTF001_031956 [Ficus carica]|uniref:Uncharacterized protein n=1 Tax=Ficus carica TaxID=3494 RepID=A0AA88E2H1_FICCA|nr:hypothetical protein TIFTF001_031956 [Ficus carica]
MEATTLLITLPLILLLSFTTNGVSARHGFSIVDEPPAVLDTNRDKLLEGKYYYLVPVIRWPHTAVIIPGVYRNDTCWFDLRIETNFYPITGLPVKFSPVIPNNDSSISESTDLIIRFSDELASACGGSSVLKAKWFLFLGASGDETSKFKIENVFSPIHRDICYKLVYSSGQVVGTSTRPDGTVRLALASDHPLLFWFRPSGNT